MAKQFLVTVTAEATISERWLVTGESAKEVRERWDAEDILSLPDTVFLDDSTLGNEAERELSDVEPYEAPDAPALLTFTAFCQKAGAAGGTTWIEQVEARDMYHASEVAILACADAWECEAVDIWVLGIAKGDVAIVSWEDQSE